MSTLVGVIPGAEAVFAVVELQAVAISPTWAIPAAQARAIRRRAAAVDCVEASSTVAVGGSIAWDSMSATVGIDARDRVVPGSAVVSAHGVKSHPTRVGEGTVCCPSISIRGRNEGGSALVDVGATSSRPIPILAAG